MKAEQYIIESLAMLGHGDLPADEVLKGCEEYICSLFSVKGDPIVKAKDLRWYLFRQLKPNQGIDKLPPTAGALYQMVLRAHLQCIVWR